MRDDLRDMLEDITHDEAREVVQTLAERFSLGQDDALKADEPPSCPWCGGDWFVKKGHDRDGGQRYLCCACGRTFNLRTRGVPPRRRPDATEG